MSKEIYESQVAKDAAKRFRMLCEYTFVTEEGDGEEMPADDMGNMGDAPAMGSAEGGTPAPDAGMNPDMGTEPMQPEDEVIDVDELTDSQEETEEKVDNISVTMEKGFEKLLNVVSRLDQMIDASTANMEQIKQEIEKRNPTPIEKLNMRAANDSYPFNVSPDEYWKQKEATSNYRIGGEDEPDAAQYTITQGDIDNITDFILPHRLLKVRYYRECCR